VWNNLVTFEHFNGRDLTWWQDERQGDEVRRSEVDLTDVTLVVVVVVVVVLFVVVVQRELYLV
jgi:hypothetical protein